MDTSTASESTTDLPVTPVPEQRAFGDRVVRVWQAALGGVVALAIGLGAGIGVDHTLFESSSSSQPPGSQLGQGQLGQGQLGQGQLGQGAGPGAPGQTGLSS